MAADLDNDNRPPRPKILDSYTADSFSEKLNKPLVLGDTWYLLDHRWFVQCKKYLGFDNPLAPKSSKENGAESHPGPINISQLLDPADPNELRGHMIEEMDYSLVPGDLFDQLKDDFGLTDGQTPISRLAREYGMFVKHVKVEIYYTTILLTQESNPDKVVQGKFSKADKLEYIVKEMRRIFEIPEDKEVRFWNKYTAQTYEMITNLASTVQESGLYAGQTVLIEVKDEDGTWPRQTKSASNGENRSKVPSPPPAPTTNGEKKDSSYIISNPKSTSTSSASNSRYTSYMDSGQVEDGKPGVCGLTNLGNTCFMNSIIQGLSNTPAIAEYFETDNYEEDINEDNPLGMKGEIARGFGQLIKDLWSGRYNHVVPRHFKMAVGRFAPQFSGYQQQDSQELLTFLLDGLHEDLNRVKQKPYVEMSDSDDKDDFEVAREAWDNYKKRNDSVILDIFHGLLKSTLVCPKCNKVSVTFDPTCYLSLPLPVKRERQIEVIFVSLTPRVPVQYRVTCPKEGTIEDLLKPLGQLVDVPHNRLVATDVYSHRFHKIYTPGDQLSVIQDKDDIFVYEISDPTDNNQVVVPVYLRLRKKASGYSPTTLFGQPFLISAPTSLTEDELYDLLLDNMSRYVSRPNPGEEWWKVPKEDKMEMAESPAQAAVSNGGAAETNGETETNGQVVTNGEAETGGSEAQSPASQASPSSETSNNMPIIQTTDTGLMYIGKGESQDEDMNSDDESPVSDRIFTVNLVNSYGNTSITDQVADENGLIRLESRNYIGLDWTARAKTLFFNQNSADESVQDDSMHSTDGPKKQVVNLEDCLKMYTSQEKLGADDAWYCPRCKEHQQATKKFDLWMLPEILVISLKRFSYNRYWRDKIDCHVNFPIEGLDMTPFVIAPGHGKSVYDLLAVSNHYGGMGGGHYTAYGKNRNDGKWYYFDDSNVTEATGNVVTKAAYVLFYQRRSTGGPATSRKDPPAAAAGSAAALVNGGPATTNGTNGVSSSDEDMDVN